MMLVIICPGAVAIFLESGMLLTVIGSNRDLWPRAECRFVNGHSGRFLTEKLHALDRYRRYS